MARLDAKRVLITGGAGGIGVATARRFVDEGASVMLVDTDGDALNAVVGALDSDRAFACVADVSQEADVRRYVQDAVDRLGGIDIFLNNAAIEGEVAPIPEYSVEAFDRVMSVNVRGAWLGMKYVMPHMKTRGGSIVITSSVAGQMGSPRLSAYCTSKHAVVGLMRTAALEGADDRIRVNTVHPGPIHTRMIYAIEEMATPGAPEAGRAIRESNIPMGRYGVPDEVTNIMLFLASDESEFCTGATYMVDGGQSAL